MRLDDSLAEIKEMVLENIEYRYIKDNHNVSV